MENVLEPSNKEQKKKTKQVTKTKKIEIQESPYYINGEYAEYYGAQPELIKWKDWVNACNVVKNSDLFKTLYKKEFFEWGAIENTACIYPVYSKEPEPVYNYDGVLIDTKPGIYDENLTLVLPPKFFFPTYRKYKNNKNFFIFFNENEFEEISFIGSKVVVTKHLAKILPDRNLIADLLHDVGNTSELSSEEEYESYLK